MAKFRQRGEARPNVYQPNLIDEGDRNRGLSPATSSTDMVIIKIGSAPAT
jgi:hypothetical protein